MAFEVFKPRGEKTEKEIVLLSKASPVLNNTAREKFGSAGIELACDKNTNEIRIKASDRGVPINKTRVLVKGFFDKSGITKKGKFKAVFNPQEKVIYMTLAPINYRTG